MPHAGSFSFHDYSPHDFKRIREIYDISNHDYAAAFGAVRTGSVAQCQVVQAKHSKQCAHAQTVGVDRVPFVLLRLQRSDSAKVGVEHSCSCPLTSASL